MAPRRLVKGAPWPPTAATAVSGAVAGAALAAEEKPGAKSAQHSGPLPRRWTEERWLLDNTIRTVGMDWDQPRSAYLSAPCGPQATADFALVRSRIQKYADAAPAFEAVARRREGVARAALDAGDTVTARENSFMAAVHWGAAQWPIDEANAQNLGYNAKKRECYGAYAKLADHRVEEAWIPMPDGKRLPAWFHLPPRYAGGRIPVVISVPGMDSFKEIGVSMYGDRWLERGLAVLAIDGPGQYEAPLLGVFFSMPAWQAAGKACSAWLAPRAGIDAQKKGRTRQTLRSFFST